MTTLKDNYVMVLPNLTAQSIYMNYYNELNQISDDARCFVPAYRLFMDHRKLEPLVENYFKEYLGQFPAQVFDKINENFIRCSFYEVLSRYLSNCYTFAVGAELAKRPCGSGIDGHIGHRLPQRLPGGGVQVFQGERRYHGRGLEGRSSRRCRSGEKICR